VPVHVAHGPRVPGDLRSRWPETTLASPEDDAGARLGRAGVGLTRAGLPPGDLTARRPGPECADVQDLWGRFKVPDGDRRRFMRRAFSRGVVAALVIARYRCNAPAGNHRIGETASGAIL
jgi:hypothetical protein